MTDPLEKAVDRAAHKRDIDEAVNAERKRCADIVMAARMGEIDGDFRCLLSRIKSGRTR